MDETSLRAHLERALSAEPPLGNLVSNSLHEGRRRRRRRTIAAALLAAAFVAAGVVPALTSDTGRKVSKPQLAAHQAVARTAYVVVGRDTVVPISLGNNSVGTPVKVQVTMADGLGPTPAAATPNARTVYELGTTYDPDPGAALTPIDTSTNRAGKTITLPNVQPWDIAVDPNGKTAYLSATDGVFPINIAANAAGKVINIPGQGWTMAFAPGGKTLYVVDNIAGFGQTPAVTPILTATNTALATIKLPEFGHTSGFLFAIAITPNGKTAYVVDDVGGGSYANSAVPIDLASNRALAPIKLKASGQAEGLVISPGGQTAYVLSSRAVTPIDTATNQAESAISLPASAGYAYRIALTANGKTIYVLTPRGAIAISTASRTVLAMIRIPHLSPLAQLAITPNGRTVYVDTETGVEPIGTATNTAGNPINLGGQTGVITFAG